MKKSCFAVLLFLWLLLLVSCGEMKDDEQRLTSDTVNTDHIDVYDTESSEETELQYLYTPIFMPYEALDYGYNMMIVEWGEVVEEINDVPRLTKPEDYIGITVNYIEIFEYTFSHYNLYKKSLPERFDSITDGERLKKTYDDIILIPKEDISEYKTGEMSFISVTEENSKIDKRNVDFYRITNTYYHEQMQKNYVFKLDFLQGRLIIPWEAYMLHFTNGDYSVSKHYVFWHLDIFQELNQYLNRIDKSYPVFESGATLEDIREYFELVTNPDTFAPLFEK